MLILGFQADPNSPSGISSIYSVARLLGMRCKKRYSPSLKLGKSLMLNVRRSIRATVSIGPVGMSLTRKRRSIFAVPSLSAGFCSNRILPPSADVSLYAPSTFS